MLELGEAGSTRTRRRDLSCSSCGYGIVAADFPSDGCPMCRGTGWLDTGRRLLPVESPRRGARRLLASGRARL